MRALATVQQQTSRPVLLGMVSSLSAAVCFGTTFVISRHVVVEYSSAPVAAFLSILSGAVLMTIIMSRDLSKHRHAPKRGFILMTLAGMCGAVGAMGNFFALSHAAVTIVSPVTAISPLSADGPSVPATAGTGDAAYLAWRHPGSIGGHPYNSKQRMTKRPTRVEYTSVPRQGSVKGNE